LDSFEGSGFEQQLVAGILEDVRVIATKKTQEKMAFVTIGDGHTVREVTVFPRTYADIGRHLVKGNFVGLGVFVRDAKARAGEDTPRTAKDVSVESVLTRAELEAGLVEQVHIATTREGLTAIKDLHAIHGTTPAAARQDPMAPVAATCLYLPDQQHPGRTYRAEAPELLWKSTPESIQALKDVLGPRVRLVYRSQFPFPPDEGPKYKSKGNGKGNPPRLAGGGYQRREAPAPDSASPAASQPSARSSQAFSARMPKRTGASASGPGEAGASANSTPNGPGGRFRPRP
jgi:hypothetical protein